MQVQPQPMFMFMVNFMQLLVVLVLHLYVGLRYIVIQRLAWNCKFSRTSHIFSGCSIYSQVLVVLVLHYDRLTGVRSSGLMFVFWLSLVVYGSLKLRSLALLAEDRVSLCMKIYNLFRQLSLHNLLFMYLLFILTLQHSVRDKFRFTTFIFQYVTYIVEFILVIIPEPKSERMYQNQEVGQTLVEAIALIVFFFISRGSRVPKRVLHSFHTSHGGGWMGEL